MFTYIIYLFIYSFRETSVNANSSGKVCRARELELLFFFRCNLISSGKSCGHDAQCSNAWDYFCMQADSGGTLWWDGLWAVQDGGALWSAATLTGKQVRFFYISSVFLTTNFNAQVTFWWKRLVSLVSQLVECGWQSEFSAECGSQLPANVSSQRWDWLVFGETCDG